MGYDLQVSERSRPFPTDEEKERQNFKVVHQAGAQAGRWRVSAPTSYFGSKYKVIMCNITRCGGKRLCHSTVRCYIALTEERIFLLPVFKKFCINYVKLYKNILQTLLRQVMEN